MRFTFLFLFILFSTRLLAQEIIEPCKFGQSLIDALQISYTPDNPLGYGPARDILYSEIDNNGLELSGIYTNFTVTLDPDEDPSVSAFNGGINAEHVYPQSLGAGDEPMRSDLHNIFPSKVNVNEARGNCPYNEIVDIETDRWFYLDIQMSNIPAMNIDDYSEKDDDDCYFEPREVVKGDIARAIFYFYCTYQSIADGVNSDFFHDQKEVLYQWHIIDPVDEKENLRNNLIAAQQGNQNPFIVDSTLVRRAFFEPDASYPEGDPDCYSLPTAYTDINKPDWISISPTMVQNELNVITNAKLGKIDLMDIRGNTIRRISLSGDTLIPVGDLPVGLYILQVQSGESIAVFRFFRI